MKALHSWLLTEGAHGMVSQVEGLAKALNTTFDHKTIRLSFIGKLLPPVITPRQKFFFNFSETVEKTEVVPDYIISCGRKSVVPNIVIKNFFKKKFNKNIKNIHIQDPKISSKYFDFIITPQHDNIVSGSNVITSKGALHYLNEEEIKNLNINNDKVMTLVLGGPNKYYNLTCKDLSGIIENLEKDIDIKKINIVASRRTPPVIFEELKKHFLDKRINYDLSLKKSNYTKSLAEASHILITCDSTSMISEAAMTGKPIYVIKLKPVKNDYRFQRFFKLFQELEIIKFFEGKIENWTYEKLYETKRIAEIITKKL